MKNDELKPSPQLLIKLGSLIVHYQEWTSSDGHALDKAAIDSIENSDDFKEWIKQMDDNAFLPKKRK